MYSLNYQPVIIIGAGRSGTNILRDVLSDFPHFGTWPCDEINYIWRHGNMHSPTDELEARHATPEVRRFIQSTFDDLARGQHLQTVVEKTCANSLRVRFVDEIFPTARYVFLVRDGRDVVASAMKRWVASIDISYILKKALYVPRMDVPYYALQYVKNQFYRLSSGEKRLAFWGPRFQGMGEALQTKTLPEVCAIQWTRCVQRSEEDFAKISPERVYQLTYESFVHNPNVEIERLANFLKVELSTSQKQLLSETISPSSVGNWQTELTSSELEQIEPFVRPILNRYSYA